MRFASSLWMIVCVASAALSVHAQDSRQPDPAQMADMEKMWEQFAAPGPEHEMFKEMDGTWKTKSTNLMGPTPEVSEGTATFKAVLGGRFLVQEYKSTFQGKPFEGMGVSGFDNAKKKYVGMWIDNVGTGLMMSEGKFDAASKTLTETSKMSSPMGDMNIKMVTQHKNENEFLFTMYMVGPNGTEQKTMEIVYTRAS